MDRLNRSFSILQSPVSARILAAVDEVMILHLHGERGGGRRICQSSTNCRTCCGKVILGTYVLECATVNLSDVSDLCGRIEVIAANGGFLAHRSDRRERRSRQKSM